jgi:hypothetical protein
LTESNRGTSCIKLGECLFCILSVRLTLEIVETLGTEGYNHRYPGEGDGKEKNKSDNGRLSTVGSAGPE